MHSLSRPSHKKDTALQNLESKYRIHSFVNRKQGFLRTGEGKYSLLLFFFFFSTEILDRMRGLLCWQRSNKEKLLSQDKNIYVTALEQDENSQQLYYCRYLYSLLLQVSTRRTNTSKGTSFGFATNCILI